MQDQLENLRSMVSEVATATLTIMIATLLTVSPVLRVPRTCVPLLTANRAHAQNEAAQCEVLAAPSQIIPA